MGTAAAIPRRIGRYQLEKELGRGAMGIVYRGFDPTIGRAVAVKAVPLDENDPDLMRRFRQEAKAAGILSHPGIVTVYDAGEDQRLFYIAMELIEGETLQHRLQRGPLSLDETISIFRQIGPALDHAHERHIVHRDVKPANIIIAGSQAKVMDFGVAKMLASTMSTTGQVFGTPSYISPEVIKAAGVDGRSDIFSLGVVLYEMLTGAKPFTGDNITTIIYKIVGEQPELPDAINPQLDPGLNQVVLKALAKNPNDRYQTCAELVADLERVNAGKAPLAVLPVGAATAKNAPSTGIAATGERPAPGKRRPGLRIALVAAAGVVAMAGALWMRRQPGPAEAERITVSAPSPPPSAAATRPEKRAESPRPPANAASAPPAIPGRPPESKTGSTTAPGSALEASAFIETKPAGAQVLVDGRALAGVTPRRFAFSYGQHKIEVRKRGFRPVERSLNVGPKALPDVSFNLVPEGPGGTLPAVEMVARIVIRSRPAGAEVLLDGNKTEFHTPVNLALSPGKHKVTLRHAGFADQTQEVVLVRNQSNQVRMELTPTRKRRWPF